MHYITHQGEYDNNKSEYFMNLYFYQSATDLMTKLEATPAAVLGTLQKIRKSIVTPRNVFVQMSASLPKLIKMYGNKKVVEVWKHFFDPLNAKERSLGEKKEEVLSTKYQVMSESFYRDLYPPSRHVIASLPGTESCYLKQAILYNDTNWDSEEAAPVRLMLQYLSDRMYDQIRGQGWTYTVGVSVSITEGRIKVYFSKASQLIPAYKEFRGIISNYSNNVLEWDPILLDSAKGSLIYNWVEIEETPEGLSSASVLAYLRQTEDSFYARKFVQRLSRVTVEDVKDVAQKYLPVFFHPNQTYTAVVCGPGEVDNVKKLFLEFDPPFQLEEIIDLEKSVLTEV